MEAARVIFIFEIPADSHARHAVGAPESFVGDNAELLAREFCWRENIAIKWRAFLQNHQHARAQRGNEDLVNVSGALARWSGVNLPAALPIGFGKIRAQAPHNRNLRID